MTRHFRGYWNLENTKDWVSMFRDKRMPVEDIAAKVGADPATVSKWLKEHGEVVSQGYHRIERQPPKISPELAKLLDTGPEAALTFLNERVWGISATTEGFEQLNKYCNFLKLPLKLGVVAAAKKIEVSRDTIRKWTLGTDQNYLARAIDTALRMKVMQGWKLLPLRLDSGGTVQSHWIQVPVAIRSYDDILGAIRRTKPLQETYKRAAGFGISRETVEQMRPEMLAYCLGMMVGDAGKLGGVQERFSSTSLALFLSKKYQENEALGEMMSMCVNSLGIQMDRIKDGDPSGATLLADDPVGSYRWNSGRSPLLAWVFFVCMGIKSGEKTSTDPVHMDWIFDTPPDFRKRFVQGLADSDGCARKYVVEICSVPNADFTTRLLLSLGMPSAYTRVEDGKELRSVVRNTEAAKLPIFNEFTHGYRYMKLMRNSNY